MNALPQIRCQIAALRDRAGKAEIEIRQVVAGRVIDDGAAAELAELSAGRFAVLSAVCIRTVEGVDVEHLGPNH